MKTKRLFSFATVAVALAVTLPIGAQARDWAHPPMVVPTQPATAQPSLAGFKPTQLRTAYGLAGIANKGAGQTIALVDAYDNPNAESDLGVFTAQFGLPACTTANGCFKKIYASGTKPPTNAGWAGESSLDIEWSYAIAPKAKIILVEAASANNAPLWHAVDVAVQNGATIVSMSFVGSEYSAEINDDAHFNVPGVTFLASSGDNGHQANFPAASPYVVAVGGTTLHLGTGNVWASETAWNGSGGGQSNFEAEPSYQASAQSSGKRGIPDVSWVADSSTGVAVYSKTGFGGWTVVGGTSVSSPCWAGVIAIANSLRVARGKSTLTQPQFVLYPAAEGDYHDITSGTNGSCGTLCTAVAGYDYVTGVGSPQGNLVVPALVAAP